MIQHSTFLGSVFAEQGNVLFCLQTVSNFRLYFSFKAY